MADQNRDSAGDDVDAVEDVEEVGKPEDETTFDMQDYLELPEEVKRRVKALKKLQLETTKIETQFFAEMHALEYKYLPLYQPLFDKRKLITAGIYEPTDAECEFGSDTECEGESLAKKVETSLTTNDDPTPPQEKAVGIPNFWLKIFGHVEMLDEMMESYDEPIISHLQDIKVEVTNEPMGFKLFFYFDKNEYFTNEVLTKTYEMKCAVDPEDPFSFEGPEIVKCTGCTIDWHKGKNVTVKTIRKKQKHKQRGSVRTLSKQVPAPSFFNFFSPPVVPADDPEAELDEDIQMRLTNDYEVGQYIRERIVPRAVLFFTGEALEDDFEEEEEDEEENDDEEDEEDEEMPEAPGNRGQRIRKAKVQKNPQDCNQQ